MVGSSANIACPNFILNTIVAEELRQFSEELEKADNFDEALRALMKRVIKEHGRIIFSGNNYSEEWKKEAEKRGLLNLRTTPDALPLYGLKKNVELFERHEVLSESEIHSRTEILLENYSNIVHIEALTALDMARKEITPAIIKYENLLLSELRLKESAGAFSARLENSVLKRVSELSEKFSESIDALEKGLSEYDPHAENSKKAEYCRDVLLPEMSELRSYADETELVLGKEFAPFPAYEDILYSVKY